MEIHHMYARTDSGPEVDLTRLIRWIQSILPSSCTLTSEDLAAKALTRFGPAIMEPITPGGTRKKVDTLFRQIMPPLSTSQGKNGSDIAISTGPPWMLWRTETLAGELYASSGHLTSVATTLSRGWDVLFPSRTLPTCSWLWTIRLHASEQYVGEAIDTTLAAWVWSHLPTHDSWPRETFAHMMHTWLEHGCGLVGTWNTGRSVLRLLYPVGWYRPEQERTLFAGLERYCAEVLDISQPGTQRVRSIASRVRPLLMPTHIKPVTSETAQQHARDVIHLLDSSGVSITLPEKNIDTSKGHPRPFIKLEEVLRTHTTCRFAIPPRLPGWMDQEPLRKRAYYERESIIVLLCWLIFAYAHPKIVCPDHTRAAERMLKQWINTGYGIIGKHQDDLIAIHP